MIPRGLTEKWARLFREHPSRIAVVFFVLGIVVHAPLLLLDCFGEQDAARLAGRATYGNLVGLLRMGGQWPYSYPLYIHMMYGLLRADILEASSLPRFMSLLSLFSSGLYSGAFALFSFRSTSSLRVTLLSGIGLQLCPVFFMNSIYGFPTISALGLFMSAVVVFQSAVFFRRSPRTTALLFFSAAMFFIIAVLFKVDVLPAAALFLLPIWQTETRKRNKVLLALTVFATSVFSFWLLNRYGASLSKDAAPEHWSNWSEKFFLGFDALFDDRNLTVISHATGILMLPAAFSALCYCIIARRNRPSALFVAAACLPIVLFWGAVEGNSARHNLILGALAPLIASLPLSSPSKRTVQIWTAGLVVVFVVDYFAYLPSADTVVPSGRLVESAFLLRDHAKELKKFGREVAQTEEDKVFVDAPPHRIPLYHFEVLSSPELEFVKSGGARLVMKKDGRKKIFVFPAERTDALEEEFLKQGYAVLTDPE